MSVIFFDDYEAESLAPGYRWIDDNIPIGYWLTEDGRLAIRAEPGQDMWGGQPIKRNAPVILRPAPSRDYYQVKCDVDATGHMGVQSLNTQVGLFVFQDYENWLFFGFTYHLGQPGESPEGNGLIATSVLGDVARVEYYEARVEDQAVLYIIHSGTSWNFNVREMNSNVIRSFAHLDAQLGAHEIGMGVKSFVGGGVSQIGFFDNFEISC